MRRLRKRFIIVRTVRFHWLMGRSGISFAHTDRHGFGVPKADTSWRTISGVRIKMGRLIVWVFFRRWPLL